MTKDVFHCRGCGDELVHREDVEVGDYHDCEECGVRHEIFENNHPSFPESIRRVD